MSTRQRRVAPEDAAGYDGASLDSIYGKVSTESPRTADAAKRHNLPEHRRREGSGQLFSGYGDSGLQVRMLLVLDWRCTARAGARASAGAAADALSRF